MNTTKKRKAPAKKTVKKSIRKAGRPPLHTEKWTKVSIVLLERQLDYLDKIAADLTKRLDRPVKRAELVRFLVESSIQSPQLEKKMLRSVTPAVKTVAK